VAADIVAAIVSGKEVDNGFLEEVKGATTAVVCSIGSSQGETDCEKEPYGAAAFPRY